jgi:hypothetical protein
MSALLTTRDAVQIDARFVTRKLLSQTAQSRCVLRWQLMRLFGSVSVSARCTILAGPEIAIAYEVDGLCHRDIARMHCTAIPSARSRHIRHWWFSCPYCKRRRRILYLMVGSPDFACRVCLRLRYWSEYLRGSSEVTSYFMMIYRLVKSVRDPEIEWETGGREVASPGSDRSNYDRQAAATPDPAVC